MIIFGLLDSHTLTSNFTNINLDSYVYTLESISEAKAHLAPHGILAISFFTERSWLGYKLYRIMRKGFRSASALVFANTADQSAQGTIGTVFLAGIRRKCETGMQNDPRLLWRMMDKSDPHQ